MSMGYPLPSSRLSERRLLVFIDVGYLKRQGAEALGITG